MSELYDEEDGPSAEEGLKFVTFFLEAFERENGRPPSVNSELFNSVVVDEIDLDINLVFEKVEDKVIIRAGKNED